jgi:tetratricopeptide (TPR) repeat protein
MAAVARIVRMVRITLLLVLSGIGMPAWSTGLGWLDIENRIEYGYFTEDLRALVDLATSLPPTEDSDALRGYYAGLVHYRLALLSASQDKVRASMSVDRCIANLDDSLKRQGDFPEALALQSVCMSLLVAMKPLRALLVSPKSTAQIERAIKLAPTNPRVLLLDALGDYDRHGAFGGGKERVIAKLQKAVSAFEAERQQVGPIPGWGAADAYTFLAGSYLDKGKPLEAREALERALLIAPEFALARRMLKRITSG